MYKRVSIALERIVMLKRVLIVTCKGVVHYRIIRMTHYLSVSIYLLSHKNQLGIESNLTGASILIVFIVRD